ncbi:MAG: DUF1350 domain-containing protein [Oscillatoriales cyanobacterium]|uniref:DUF1350 family protein n=1 Tax=Microcoleus anatoxicus PTRS2 TaxID=2705321 RepID=A0ABU8YTS7_9CYAN|nr:MAG: DUF1350 domain-containing protein [Oscillatoriales cyanobacterium]TAF02572.1 MAG: DUF1350 domain-containing protein [Oscillatoriales cyanobacterium]TAF37978.1 MAG: DUF1350 domain-containing protein [Oscillatoriales cyanobacterium]TAF68258.1 MAG: DUF1350 domain-containing protein [Oscillatoriales cyanobacterium]
MDWQEISGNWVLIPSTRPIAIVHFLGGAFVATAPHLTYRWLLETLGNQGYVVVATPFVNTLDHIAIARDVLNKFENALGRLQAMKLLRSQYLPIYGMGHSMGCKLHLLIGAVFDVERSGNILISFNNYAASEAIPIVEQISPVFNVEFTPSPQDTNRLVKDSYQIRRNLLIKFKDDNIDQTLLLTDLLKVKYSDMITVQILAGNHQTPLGQDVSWPMGQIFTPFDAIGQWVKQEVYRELNQLKKTVLLWLNPVSKI